MMLMRTSYSSCLASSTWNSVLSVKPRVTEVVDNVTGAALEGGTN